MSALLAIVRYEFLLHWRRRALVVLMVSLLPLPLLGAFLSRAQVGELALGAAQSGLTAAYVREQITLALLPLTWPPTYLVLALMLPSLMAEALPRDRQLGLHDLFGSLPLTPATYLLGKLLGAWASILAGLGAAAVVIGAVWWWGVGPFEGGFYAQLWLMGATVLGLTNAGVGLLLGATQPTRRRAVFVGIAFAVVCILALMTSLSGTAPHPLLQWLNPGRPLVFIYYIAGWVEQFGHTPAALGKAVIPTLAEVLWANLAGLGEVALLWGVVWGWLKWEAHRA